MTASTIPWIHRLNQQMYDRVCVNCGYHTAARRAVEQCHRCGIKDYWATCSMHGVLSLPAGSRPCPDCGLEKPLSLRIVTRVSGHFLHAQQQHQLDYVCQECAERRVISALLWTTFLGWWSLESFLIVPLALFRTWYAIIGSPLNPKRWGGMDAKELSAMRSNDWRAQGSNQQPGGQPQWNVETPFASSSPGPMPPPPPVSAFTPLSRLVPDQQAKVIRAPRNAYRLLGIDQTSTYGEIQKAYRISMKEAHPDLHPDDPSATERMVILNQIWELLQDEDLRAAYDWVSNQRARGALI